MHSRSFSNYVRRDFYRPRKKSRDNLVGQLEFSGFDLKKEHKKTSYIEGNIQKQEKRLRRVSRNLSSPKFTSNNELKKEIQRLEHQLDQERKAISQVKSLNLSLKSQIDELRNEKKFCKSNIEEMQSQIKLNCEKSIQVLEEQTLDQSQIDKCKEKVYFTRTKSMDLRQTYKSKAIELKTHSKHRKSNLSFFITESNPTVSEITSFKHLEVLKKVLKKWQQKCETKTKELKDYTKTIRTLKSGFKKIKRHTGVGKYSEIATTLIKSEDQQDEVLAYLLGVLDQIEHFETSPKVTRHSDFVQNQKKLYTNRSKNWAFKSKQLLQKTQKLQQSITNSKEPLTRILELFEKCKLKPSYPLPLTDTEMSTENILDFVSLIDDIASQIITINSISQQKKLPALKNTLVHKAKTPRSSKPLELPTIKDTDDKPREKKPLSKAYFVKRVKQSFDFSN